MINNNLNGAKTIKRCWSYEVNGLDLAIEELYLIEKNTEMGTVYAGGFQIIIKLDAKKYAFIGTADFMNDYDQITWPDASQVNIKKYAAKDPQFFLCVVYRPFQIVDVNQVDLSYAYNDSIKIVQDIIKMQAGFNKDSMNVH